MEPELARFLQAHTGLAQGRVVWPLNGAEFVQTCTTYPLDELPPLRFVTSVRAIVTRGQQVLVVQDPVSEHILPGGRIRPGEGLLAALQRELLEETGWAVCHPPRLLGLFHFHIHSPRPDSYPYPYPDYLQVIYQAQAEQHRPQAMEKDGYEIGCGFRPRAAVDALPLSPGEAGLLGYLNFQERT